MQTGIGGGLFAEARERGIGGQGDGLGGQEFGVEGVEEERVCHLEDDVHGCGGSGSGSGQWSSGRMVQVPNQCDSPLWSMVGQRQVVQPSSSRGTKGADTTAHKKSKPNAGMGKDRESTAIGFPGAGLLFNGL